MLKIIDGASFVLTELLEKMYPKCKIVIPKIIYIDHFFILYKPTDATILPTPNIPASPANKTLPIKNIFNIPEIKEILSIRKRIENIIMGVGASCLADNANSFWLLFSLSNKIYLTPTNIIKSHIRMVQILK